MIKRDNYWLQMKNSYGDDSIIKLSDSEVEAIYRGDKGLHMEHLNWFRYLDGMPPTTVPSSRVIEAYAYAYVFNKIEKYYNTEVGNFHIKDGIL